MDDKSESAAASLLRNQTLSGRIKVPEEGDPVYMLATFRDDNLFLSPVSSVVQLRPQLHHLDALDDIPKSTRGGGKSRKDDAGEDRPAESEARAVDVKIKAAASEDKEAALVAGNLELLKKMQEEKWAEFDWVDAETQEAWDVYDAYMMYHDVEGLPQLQSALDTEDYLDSMSAPRIDPARPDMTGWAMKENRRRQREAEAR
ncbi:hypothetical protein PHISP_08114 [Aspergillus sp. HF37]|nr:hypothetical protein PHISP_08114 [Aspergillus sp. HF37]